MANDPAQQVTFSFGENWRDFVDTIDEADVQRAVADLRKWLGEDGIAGKTVLDIGSGSGIHSLCFLMLGAKSIVSFDVDPKSVESTRLLWEKAGKPEKWRVLEGSVLEKSWVEGLEPAEIVYSWGVLHHTGAMWEAIGNALTRVALGGQFLIAIYGRTATYAEDLALKQRYNSATPSGKKAMVRSEILKIMKHRLRTKQNPFTWNEKVGRGMDTYHDLIDWLGGLPYEVAGKVEMEAFFNRHGFALQRWDDTEANIVYLFEKS